MQEEYAKLEKEMEQVTNLRTASVKELQEKMDEERKAWVDKCGASEALRRKDLARMKEVSYTTYTWTDNV